MFCRLTTGPRMSHRGTKQNATQTLCLNPEHSMRWEGRDVESCHCFGQGGSGRQDPRGRPKKMLIAGEPFPVRWQQNKWIKLTLHCQRKSQRS